VVQLFISPGKAAQTAKGKASDTMARKAAFTLIG
jgi:hypothetical protein